MPQPMSHIPDLAINNNPNSSGLPPTYSSSNLDPRGPASPNLIRGASNTSLNRSPSPYSSGMVKQGSYTNPGYQNPEGYHQPNYRNQPPPNSNSRGYSNTGYPSSTNNNMYANQGFEQAAYYSNNSSYDPRLTADPRSSHDPRMSHYGNYNPPGAYGTIPGRSPNMHTPPASHGHNYGNMGYDQKNYSQHGAYGMNNPNVPIMDSHSMNPAYTYQANENAYHEAIALCMALKSNQNDPMRANRLNELLKNPNTKARVDDYLKTMIRK